MPAGAPFAVFEDSMSDADDLLRSLRYFVAMEKVRDPDGERPYRRVATGRLALRRRANLPFARFDAALRELVRQGHVRLVIDEAGETRIEVFDDPDAKKIKTIDCIGMIFRPREEWEK